MLIWFLAMFFFSLLATFVYAGWSAAPWVPMRAGDIERVLKLAKIEKGQNFYDLGCGDGRVLIATAKEGAVSKGFEVSVLPYLISKTRLVFQKGIKAVVEYKDFWHQDLREADIVYFFLMPSAYSKLKLKLERELKQGAKVISYVWPVESWQPIAVDKAEKRLPLYLYQIESK